MKTINILPYLLCMVITTLLLSSCEEEKVDFSEPSEEPTASLHEELMAESELLLQAMQRNLKGNSNARTSTSTSIDTIFFDLNIEVERGELEGQTTTLPVALTSVRRVNSNNFIYNGTITAENGVEGFIDLQYRPQSSNSLTISFIFDAILPDGSQGENAVIFGQSTESFTAIGFALAPSATGSFETITFDRGFLSLNSVDPSLRGSAFVSVFPADGINLEQFIPFITADSTEEYLLRIDLIEGLEFFGTFTLTSARKIADIDNTIQLRGTIEYFDGKRGEIRYNIIPATREITASLITRFTQTDAGAVDFEGYVLGIEAIGGDFEFDGVTVGRGDLFDSQNLDEKVGTIVLGLR